MPIQYTGHLHRVWWAAPPLGREGLRLYGLDTDTFFCCCDLSLQLPSGLNPGFQQQDLGGEADAPFPLLQASVGTVQANFISLTLPSHHWNFTIFFLFNLISLKSASSHKFKDVLCSLWLAQNIRGPFYSLWLHAISPFLGNCWRVSQKDVLIN